MKPTQQKGQSSKGWDWVQVIHFGLFHMRLSPADFWQLSVREMRALLPPLKNKMMQRDDLENLLNLYPDQEIS